MEETSHLHPGFREYVEHPFRTIKCHDRVVVAARKLNIQEYEQENVGIKKPKCWPIRPIINASCHMTLDSRVATRTWTRRFRS